MSKLRIRDRFSFGRLHLLELEDQTWFPRTIRDAGTDFMRFVAEVAKLYRSVAPRLGQALTATGSQEILDLCSGGAGPIISIRDALAARGCTVPVNLTDKFPNRNAFEYVKQRSQGRVNFIGSSIDATAVPPDLSGFRTLFSGLHHFRPSAAHRILQDAVDQRRPIGVFEVTQRRLVYVVAALLLPLGIFLSTPFIRPFRWSRIFWTYVVPVVPVFVTWDALVSCLRTYSPKELRALVDGINCEDYCWDIGVERDHLIPICYLIGYPNPPDG